MSLVVPVRVRSDTHTTSTRAVTGTRQFEVSGCDYRQWRRQKFLVGVLVFLLLLFSSFFLFLPLPSHPLLSLEFFLSRTP